MQQLADRNELELFLKKRHHLRKGFSCRVPAAIRVEDDDRSRLRLPLNGG